MGLTGLVLVGVGAYIYTCMKPTPMTPGFTGFGKYQNYSKQKESGATNIPPPLYLTYNNTGEQKKHKSGLDDTSVVWATGIFLFCFLFVHPTNISFLISGCIIIISDYYHSF